MTLIFLAKSIMGFNSTIFESISSDLNLFFILVYILSFSFLEKDKFKSNKIFAASIWSKLSVLLL